MPFNPSTKLTNTERITMFRRLLEKGTSLKMTCHLLDASKDDLREFARLSAPELMEPLEAMIGRSEPASHTNPGLRFLHRRRREARARSSNVASVKEAPVGKTQILADFILGELHFPEDDRPFNRLPEDQQDDIRRQVEDFMDVHGHAAHRS